MQPNFEYLDDLIPEFEGLEKTSLDKLVRQKWVDEKQEQGWIENYKKIKHRLKPAKIRDDGINKACIIIGSSPAIEKQVDTLKNLGDNFILISSNGAYRYLCRNGIVPDYVFIMESREHVINDLTQPLNGTKLVASPFINAKILDNWGKNYENYLVGGGPKFTPMIEKDFEVDIAGGNVVNTSLLWAYKYLRCRNFIFIGCSLCYYDDYYIDKKSTDNVLGDFEKQKGFYNAADMHGEVVNTTLPLLMYKVWLETYSSIMNIDMINSTEDGILGVYPKPIGRDKDGIKFQVHYLPWINIAPLEMAIRAFTKKFNNFGG